MPQRTALLELARWFQNNRRPMPWRQNPSPYGVWVSEVMLQQTTVAAVIPFFERFMERFPTLAALAAADEQDVLALWAGLGYYSRARNLLQTARILGTEAAFPKTLPELKALPGIGPYTAGAVASIAFGLPVPLADTNVQRVLGRLYAMERAGGFAKLLLQRAEILVHEAHALGINGGIFNQAIMEIGSLVCTPQRALCGQCPLQNICLGKNDPLAFAKPRAKPAPRPVEEDCFVEVSAEGVLLVQSVGRRRRGLWDFPCRRGEGAKDGEPLGVMSYAISNDRVTRHIFLKIFKARPLEANEIFLTPQGGEGLRPPLTSSGGEGLQPPLTSPARKIFRKYGNIINKVVKSLDKGSALL